MEKVIYCKWSQGSTLHPIPVERLDGLLVGVHLKDLGGRDVGYWNPRDCPWLRW
jgi:hypothetical protein